MHDFAVSLSQALRCVAPSPKLDADTTVPTSGRSLSVTSSACTIVAQVSAAPELYVSPDLASKVLASNEKHVRYRHVESIMSVQGKEPQ